MTSRLPVVLMLVGVTAAAALLAFSNDVASVVEQEIGPTGCRYDDGVRSVVVSAPVAVETDGKVSWEVQAQVRDRRDPSRMPYVSTRLVTFDTDGRLERHDVELQIAMPRREWLAGHDDCGISVRTVPSP